MAWFFPLLFVAMLGWTVFMWPRLEKMERWIAIITLAIVVYAIFQ